jgi:hypothetical protein
VLFDGGCLVISTQSHLDLISRSRRMRRSRCCWSSPADKTAATNTMVMNANDHDEQQQHRPNLLKSRPAEGKGWKTFSGARRLAFLHAAKQLRARGGQQVRNPPRQPASGPGKPARFKIPAAGPKRQGARPAPAVGHSASGRFIPSHREVHCRPRLNGDASFARIYENHRATKP